MKTVALILALLCFFMGFVQYAHAGTVRPDIVVFMVDDLGDVQRVLQRQPIINSMFIQNGLRLNNLYNETPLCCPARATFLTGQHTRLPDGHGVYSNKDILKLDASRTIATVLQDSGYTTILSGRYLNESVKLNNAMQPGWDHMLWWYRAAVSTGPATTVVDGHVTGTNVPMTEIDRYTVNTTPGYIASAPADKPLFLWATTQAPHTADNSSQYWVPFIEDRYVGDPRCNDIAAYKPPSYDWDVKPNGFPLYAICRSMLTVDDLVASVRSAMVKRGRPTVYMFMSDNGMSWGEHGFAQKGNPWSGKLAAYVVGDGFATGTTNALVSNIDISPTIADLAGTSMPFAHGESFVDTLLGNDGVGRDSMVEDYLINTYAGPWKTKWEGVRQGHWHLISRPINGVWKDFLYDLQADPWQQTNVAANNPGVLSSMRNNLP